jgi:23S rRNA (cytosine1962-C5)-methyltransferase
MTSAVVKLKPGHVQPVWAGHPWVYAQAVDRVEGNPTSGDEVRVMDPRGNFLGRGFYSPESAIPVRILTHAPEEALDGAFFRRRLERAAARRAELGLPSDQTTGFRLVHAEGDELPGLIVDRFGDVAVMQVLTAGMKRREGMILDAIVSLGVKTVLDRTPPNTAKAEKFEPRATPLAYGPEVREIAVKERGLSYRLPIELGQKTGFYFDQRDLRARVEGLARGKRVLDAYSYVGAFAMAAARGGASSVLAVDDSAPAVEAAQANVKDNGLEGVIELRKQDARKTLQENVAAFDLVVLDPPRLAPSKRAAEGALVAYAKLAEAGVRATKPGGVLVLCSCSAAIDLHALTRSLAIGAMRAGMQAFVFDRCFQGADHPVSAAFGEGLYLKAVLARVEAR